MIDSFSNPLLAELGLESVLRFLPSTSHAQVYYGLIFSVLAAAVMAIAFGGKPLISRLGSGSVANPRRLFLQLCRGHMLSGKERRQLEHLADLLGLSTPALLMIDAATWQLDELIAQKKIQPQDHDHLLTLQKTLYDQPRLSIES